MGPNPPDGVTGIAGQLFPGTSEVDFLGDLKRVVDLNAEIAYGVEFLSIEAAGDPQSVARPLAQHPEGIS
jgi:hypothetical protein